MGHTKVSIVLVLTLPKGVSTRGREDWVRSRSSEKGIHAERQSEGKGSDNLEGAGIAHRWHLLLWELGVKQGKNNVSREGGPPQWVSELTQGKPVSLWE